MSSTWDVSYKALVMEAIDFRSLEIQDSGTDEAPTQAKLM